MDVNSLQAYTDMYTKESTSSKKLQESLKTTNYAGSSEEELLAACKEFEAYFLEMVFKEMQKSVNVFSDKKNDANSQIVDYFRDMTIQQLASDSTERQGLGLAQQLFEQMKRNYNMP
jgi:flagellar protein FlgJ